MGGSLVGRIALCWWVTSWLRGTIKKKKGSFSFFLSTVPGGERGSGPLWLMLCSTKSFQRGVLCISALTLGRANGAQERRPEMTPATLMI